MITEHLMRPGGGSLRFVTGVPASTTRKIMQLVDENAGSEAVGAHVMITPTHVNPTELSDANMLDLALYTGAITARPSRLSIEFTGLGAWLDTYTDTDETRAAGTPTQWVGDLARNGLTTGTITGGSNVSRTFPAHGQTARQALDAWATLAGVEYHIMPDFTIDAAVASTLFTSPPTVVVTRRAEGPDGPYRGVDGSMLTQALTQLGPQLATKAVALTEGNGSAIVEGSDTQTLNLKTQSGGTPALVRVFSAPSEESANANASATSFLALQGMRRQIKVSSRTHHLPRYVVPGDEVYVYDVTAGLHDSANQILFRGEVISPALVRLLAYSWPIESGYGVYLRSNAATPTYTDLTEWIDWEDGSDTWWTVGDWSPPGYGPINRTNPDVEERVASGRWRSFTPSWTNLSVGNAPTNGGDYQYVDGGMRVRLRLTFGSTTSISGAVQFTVPNGETSRNDGSPSLGPMYMRDDSALTEYTGVARCASGATVITLFHDGNNVSSTAPFTWTTDDILECDITIAL